MTERSRSSTSRTGVLASVKRRLSSGNEESRTKKAHQETIMEKEDIKEAFRDVLAEEGMSDMLSKAFEKSLQKVTERVETLEMKDDNKEGRLIKIEERMEKETQDSRGNNIIITGLQKEDLAKENMVTKINEILDSNIQESDIKWVQKLVFDEQSVQHRKSKLRVVFKDAIKRDELFKLKPKLKGHNIWITDDLTSHSSNLAYLARQAEKTKKIKKTWVYGGRIFIVKNEDDRPVKISKKEDIPT
jgi:hypothetical protein